MTCEEISHMQRIGRDEEARSTTVALVEFDELCATARGGARLADMLRGFILHAENSGEGDEPDIKALRQFLNIAGFEPCP